jgi:hypothetical protein
VNNKLLDWQEATGKALKNMELSADFSEAVNMASILARIFSLDSQCDIVWTSG